MPMEPFYTEGFGKKPFYEGMEDRQKTDDQQIAGGHQKTDNRPEIEIVHGDILFYSSDAMVVPTDWNLSGGGGLDRLVHEQAGEELSAKCQKLRKKIHISDAVLTSGFAFPKNYLIHAVSPIWQGGELRELDGLELCCRNIIKAANAKSDIHTITMPLLGTGVNGFPLISTPGGVSDTAITILKGLNRALYEQPWGRRTVQKVVIVCRNETKYQELKKAERYLFGQGISFRDRIRGCLLGGAVGDAMGYPVEFIRGPHAMIEDYILTDGKALISDDTQMTLFTACGILWGDTRTAFKTGGTSGAHIEPSWLAMAYRDWYRTQVPDEYDDQLLVSWIRNIPELNERRAPGHTCMNALANVKKTWKEAKNFSKGCGGVMRIAPIPLYMAAKGGTDQVENANICAQAASVTHGHELGWMSAAALGNILYNIMQNFSLRWSIEETLHFLQKKYKNCDYTEDLITLIKTAVSIADMSGYSSTPNIMLEFDGNRELGEGWTGEEALAIAVCCALDGKGFRQNILSAIGHNGDSDSTGSIAGQIMGAYWGESAIPNEWLAPLELRETIEEIAEDLARASQMTKDDEYENEPWMQKYLDLEKSVEKMQNMELKWVEKM